MRSLFIAAHSLLPTGSRLLIATKPRNSPWIRILQQPASESKIPVNTTAPSSGSCASRKTRRCCVRPTVAVTRRLRSAAAARPWQSGPPASPDYLINGCFRAYRELPPSTTKSPTRITICRNSSCAINTKTNQTPKCVSPMLARLCRRFRVQAVASKSVDIRNLLAGKQMCSQPIANKAVDIRKSNAGKAMSTAPVFCNNVRARAFRPPRPSRNSRPEVPEIRPRPAWGGSTRRYTSTVVWSDRSIARALSACVSRLNL
jgi:hypothetical protein